MAETASGPVPDGNQGAARRVHPYRPFRDFKDWQGLQIDPTPWLERHEAIRGLAGGDTELLKEAFAVAQRAAAFESGAIEDLYASNRGITLSIAASASLFSAAIQQEKAKSLIESLVSAYDYVLDFVTGKQPLAEAWARELHAVVCGAQETYTVWAGDGSSRNEPLPKGQYKTLPNNVLQKDGSIHEYAPPEDCAPEMQRLFEQINSEEFSRGNPILQAAYAHHSAVAIHPFADGNGRFSRALASVFTYRAARIPLLLFSDSRDEYFEALATADAGNFLPLAGVISRAGITALDLVAQSLRTAKRTPISAAAGLLRKAVTTRGGYSHYDVERTTVVALNEARSWLDPSLKRRG